MNRLITLSLLLVIVFSGNMAIAQKETNVDALMTLSAEFNAEWELAQERVINYAQEHNLPIRYETSKGNTVEMVDVVDGQPKYYIKDNLEAAITTQVSELWVGGSTGLDYDGEGYSQLGEWDAGHVRKTHQEFNQTGVTRVTPMDGNYSTHYHATHVAGTMVAGGVVEGAKGALYAGNLKYWQWSNDNSEMAAAAAAGLEISNHSYGGRRGWDYDGGWDWYGTTSISPNEDYKFGFYNYDARAWDVIAQNAPNYLIVKSAGNDRGDGPNQGTPENDGGDDGFDCIGPEGVSKNILTVGAVKKVLDYTGPESVLMSDFSSWGPADDGRIKPDIVGKGVNVYSTFDGSNTDYSSISGTSMSAPNVSGSLAMLQYHYQETHGPTPMRSATLKGLAIHTTKEAGPHPGPDYMFGWGLMNAKAAAAVITDDVGQNTIDELELNADGTYTREVNVPEGEDFTVTICWTDVPGTPTSAQLNPSDPMLVNDLDLRVTDPNSDDHYPWSLDRNNKEAAATRFTKNYVDNVEKIEIMNAPGGTYIITVDHDGSMTGSSQAFSIIFSGIDDYDVVPECTAGLTSPLDGGTDANLNHTVTWFPAPFATGYDIYLGTDGGGTSTPTNAINGETVYTNSFSYLMNRNTTYYLQVVPRNSNGVATGCDDIYSYTTMGAITSYPYEEGAENVTKPDLPDFWQAYNYSERRWESTNLIANNGSQALACFYSNGLEEVQYDNWLVSPPFEVSDGNEYNASFYYKGFIPGHSESMNVYWGYSPNVEDMTNTILEAADITEANFELAQGVIIPNSDTLVFLGFHVYSPTGYGVFLDDVKFENWGTVGINPSVETQQPKIYASSNSIIVKTDDAWNGAKVDVLSIIGQSVISSEHNTISNFDMSKYGPGIYLVRLQKGENYFTRKLIVR